MDKYKKSSFLFFVFLWLDEEKQTWDLRKKLVEKILSLSQRFRFKFESRYREI